MDSFNFEKIINDYEKRLKHLENLYKSTNDWKERNEIKEEIDAKTFELEKKKAEFKEYKEANNSDLAKEYMNRLYYLHDLYDSTKDYYVKTKIKEEIEAKEKELQQVISKLNPLVVQKAREEILKKRQNITEFSLEVEKDNSDSKVIELPASDLDADKDLNKLQEKFNPKVILLPEKTTSLHDKEEGESINNVASAPYTRRVVPQDKPKDQTIIYETKINKLIADAYLNNGLESLKEARNFLYFINDSKKRNKLEEKIKKAENELKIKIEKEEINSRVKEFKVEIQNIQEKIDDYELKELKESVNKLKEDFNNICNNSKMADLIDIKEYLEIVNNIIFRYNIKEKEENRILKAEEILDEEVEHRTFKEILTLNAKRIKDKIVKKSDNTFMNTISVLCAKNKLSKLKYKLYKNGVSGLNKEKRAYNISNKIIAKRLLKHLLNQEIGLKEDCKNWLELISVMPNKLRVYKTNYEMEDILSHAKTCFDSALDSGVISHEEYDGIISIALDICHYREEVDDFYVLPNGKEFITYVDEDNVIKKEKQIVK